MGGERGQSEVKGAAVLLCLFRIGVHAAHNYHIEQRIFIYLFFFRILYKTNL